MKTERIRMKTNNMAQIDVLPNRVTEKMVKFRPLSRPVLVRYSQKKLNERIARIV
jgi:hypothetical protein